VANDSSNLRELGGMEATRESRDCWSIVSIRWVPYRQPLDPGQLDHQQGPSDRHRVEGVGNILPQLVVVQENYFLGLKRSSASFFDLFSFDLPIWPEV